MSKLFEHLSEEHGLNLLESELREIELIVLNKMTMEKKITLTFNDNDVTINHENVTPMEALGMLRFAEKTLYIKILKTQEPKKEPEKKSDDSILTKKLFWDDLKFNWSVRTINTIQFESKAALGEEILTVGDLVKYSRRDLLKIRNFGKKTLDEVDLFLRLHNLGFAK